MSKMAASLEQRLGQIPADQPVPVIVQYTGHPPAPAGRGPSAQVTIFNLLPFAAMSLPASAVAALAANESIVQIWPDLPVHVWLDESVPLIGAPQVWTAGFRGKGISVAVVDTGIDVTHPDLAGRILATADFSGEGFQDNHGHGTHCSGIIAGNGKSSAGRFTGVAPEATLLGAKVLKGDGSGATSNVMAGVDWAVDVGARVINLSLGADGACDGSDPMSQMCDAAVAQGVVVCVAAGNAGPNPRTVGSPGCAFHVITVGASDRSDHVASFSSRGPTEDNRLKPDLCFPGVSIASCRARGTSMGQVVDDFYTRASGTSMATPHCSGACALLLEAGPSRTPQAIKDLLMNAAKDLQTDSYAQGRGRAQVYKSYMGEATPPPPPPPPPPPGGGPRVRPGPAALRPSTGAEAEVKTARDGMSLHWNATDRDIGSTAWRRQHPDV